MILEGVRVEGFRCFVRSTDVRGFSAGLNVVSAPNGTGKSTLFEAIRRALIDHHTVAGVEAEKMRPWGRSIAPVVTVDFVHAAQRYRVQKRFLDAASCDLFRWEVDAFIAVDRGERADEKVRALLSRPTAPKGLSREAHWGLAQVLWAPQGMIELGPLGPELATRVRDTLAAQVVGARGAEIERAVEERFRQYFTPQTSKLKTGRRAPEVVRKDEELALARAAVERARERHERTALTQERVGALRTELAEAERQRAELEREVRACDEKLRAFDQAEKHQRDALLREREAESQLRASRAQLEAWRAARAAIEQGERAHAEAARSALAAQTERDEHAREAQRALDRELESERAREELRAIRAQIAAQEERTRARATFEQARERLGLLEDAERALRSAEAALGTALAPSDHEIDRARRAHAQRERALSRLESLAITVHVRALAPLRIQSESEQSSSGDAQVIRGLGGVRLTLEGVAELRVEGPVSEREVEQARAQLREADEALGAIEARWQSSDPATLAAQSAVHRERLAAVREQAARLEALGGARAREECERQVRAWHEREHERDPEDDRGASSEALAHWTAEAERVGDHRSLVRARRECERSASEREAALAVAHERAGRCRSELDRARFALEALRAQSESEAACAAEHERALLAFDAARVAAARAREALEGRAAIDHARAQWSARLATTDAAVLSLRDAARMEEGRLDELTQGASFAVLARAEEELARIEADSQRLHLEADAVKLLRETLTRARDEAVAKVAGEVERAAERILGTIAGRARVRVELGETFAPSRARVGEGEGVALEALSGGEREQVHFAVRLALAEVLAQEERPMVVLDDVLVATDSARLRRVIEVLEDAASRMQVIVLTCHPERYEHANGATHLKLDAGVVGAGS